MSQHPFARALDSEQQNSPATAKLFALLKTHAGTDFTLYKFGTVGRRLRRRILIHKVDSVEAYLEIVIKDRAELDELYRDMLINVTSFFRDNEVFDYLKEKVFSKLVKRQQGDGPIRVWIAGCSTGEEAYSHAIALFETMEMLTAVAAIQIFASDLSESALERARDGFYPDSIRTDVSAERLRRFFVKAPGGYRIASNLRDCCVFAKHDITRDPPFSRMDLVSCRNLLIYLRPEVQKKVLGYFAYALNPRAYLVLGSSETVSNSSAFDLKDKKLKVYGRKQILPSGQLDIPLAPKIAKMNTARLIPKVIDPIMELEREVTRILLRRFAPDGLVVGKNMQILQFRGQTGAYLEPSSGEASLNLFKMAKSGLDTELRILIKKVDKTNKPQTKGPVSLLDQGQSKLISIEVIPLKLFDEGPYYLVLFSVLAKGEPVKEKDLHSSLESKDSNELRANQAKEELQALREHLQSIIGEQDATNEELQAANEEIISSNEELQATNEELETAKEELQSSNEELTTVNDELSNRNGQLLHVNNDLNNLLGSINIPIIMVGNDLRIRRFTSIVERVLNVIPSDVGRPITHIKPNIDLPDLESLIVQTIETVQMIEREVQDRSGRWYSLRIRPYRTDDNKIDGAVLVLFDISLLKRGRTKSVASAEQKHLDFENIEQPVAVLTEHYAMHAGNSSFYDLIRETPEAVFGKDISTLAGGSFNVPVLKALLADIIPHNHQIVDYSGELKARLGAPTVHFVLNARRVKKLEGPFIVIFFDLV